MEKQLNEKESLDIIMNMINKVKADLEDNSFYFLLWGWLVFAASMGNYILIMIDYPQNYLPWMLMPLGAVITVVYSMKQQKHQRIKTYVDEFMKYVLIAFLTTLCITLFMMQKLELNTYPVLLMIYGIWLFVSGGVIKFIPLVVGGIINWVIAIIAFFVSFQIQLLLLAVAVLLGYIIPGHLLKNKFAKLKTQQP